MSLFRVFVDGKLFYHPQLSQLAITQAQVKEDAENIDSFTLSAPHNHPYLDFIKPMASTIVCKKDDAVVFEGRAIDDGSDFYSTHTWTCESALSYLRDTLMEPFDYQGAIRGLLELFIENHNQNVEDKKHFSVGDVTVPDSNDYIHYSNSEYSVTLDAIKDKLLKTHGGYLFVRYTETGKVLDYLEDFNTYSVQRVEFGKNLLDVKIKKDHAERVTALLPLGAKIKETDEEGKEEETGKRVGIAEVNEGIPYVHDEEAVKEIGWIWSSEVWEDVTQPGILLSKAKTMLAELVQGIVSMELTIVDESDTGADIGDIHARQYVDCLSSPHGIDGRYLCIAKTTDYLNPSSNTITIGASGIKLTNISVKQNENITALEENVLGFTAEIEKIPGVEDNVAALTESVKECYSEISKSANEIVLSVNETYAEKSELEVIKKDFETSITQSSSEIRLDFTALTDEIKGTVATNQSLLEEYIRFKGALIELGKVGNAFTAELSNEELSFKENGQRIAYISNQQLVITNAEIRNKLSLGNEIRGWFDFIPRQTGNLSIKWRDPA